jgi:hypothetical protein
MITQYYIVKLTPVFKAILHAGFVTHACVPKRLPETFWQRKALQRAGTNNENPPQSPFGKGG